MYTIHTETLPTADRKNHIDELRGLLTVDDLSALLKINKSWVYGKLHSRTLPFPVVYVGRFPRFRAADVARYLESQTRPAGAA